MIEILLTGIDGSNPLGFLAALGVFNIITDYYPDKNLRLFWRKIGGCWRPVLPFSSSNNETQAREVLLKSLQDDLASWSKEPAMELRYSKPEGKDSKSKSEKLVWDLKPPSGIFREYLVDVLEKSSFEKRRSIDHAAAFATDVAVDGKGNTKPTALHFTAGRQEFLAIVAKLQQNITKEDFDEALFGPWQYRRDLPVFQWDATDMRDYALRAKDPSEDKKFGIPGADWLAFRGLSFFPVVPSGKNILTTGCTRSGKIDFFCWPLWILPLEKNTIRSLLQMENLFLMYKREQHARGIGIIFKSSIRRGNKGYGNFNPAEPI